MALSARDRTSNVIIHRSSLTESDRGSLYKCADANCDAELVFRRGEQRSYFQNFKGTRHRRSCPELLWEKAKLAFATTVRKKNLIDLAPKMIKKPNVKKQRTTSKNSPKEIHTRQSSDRIKLLHEHIQQHGMPNKSCKVILPDGTVGEAHDLIVGADRINKLRAGDKVIYHGCLAYISAGEKAHPDGGCYVGFLNTANKSSPVTNLGIQVDPVIAKDVSVRLGFQALGKSIPYPGTMTVTGEVEISNRRIFIRLNSSMMIWVSGGD